MGTLLFSFQEMVLYYPLCILQTEILNIREADHPLQRFELGDSFIKFLNYNSAERFYTLFKQFR